MRELVLYLFIFVQNKINKLLLQNYILKDKVAVKILDKFKMQTKVKKLLAKEIPCMEHLHHPNIIRFYEVIETFSKIFIIMEYASNGELYKKIVFEGKLPDSVAKIYFAQIISALQHMVKFYNFIFIKSYNYFNKAAFTFINTIHQRRLWYKLARLFLRTWVAGSKLTLKNGI